MTDREIEELTLIEKQRVESVSSETDFGQNLWNYYQFLSWARFYPDLFVQIYKGKDSNRQLHYDQRIFMRSDLRFMSMYGTFSRGYAKCIKGDSLIFTDEGIREIGEFFNYQNDNIETHYNTQANVVNRYGELEKTKLGLYNGKQDCITVKTSDGYEITGTRIHKVLVMNKDGEIVFKKLSDIKCGEQIVINRKNDVWGEKSDVEIRKYYDVKEFPKEILVANKDIVTSFIRMLYDSHGLTKHNTIHFSSESHKLIKQLQIVLLNYGIISSRKQVENISQLSIEENNMALLCELIGLNNKNDCHSSSVEDYYFSKVQEIEYSIEDVYDFHLPKTHSFVSNGFVSHNTYTEVLDCFIVAILYPGITLSITAQTRENSAALLEDKYNEIMNDFPLMENEVDKKKFSKNDAFIKWKNGSTISNLANAQSSKGRRRHRIKIEESALLNNTLYEDALEPIVEVPRTTTGSSAVIDPEEMNFQIHFFTTSGYRGSDEYNRSVRMVNGMRNCSGDIVLGSGWMLPCYYGRGSTKTQILKKKRRSNPIFFDQNYEEKWVGCSNGALVDINKLMACRVLTEPVLEIQNVDDEFYIGVDVARSENTSNNKTAISVIKVHRNKNTNRIVFIDIVNVYSVPATMNFTDQACLVKKYKKNYHAKMVIADGNGLGSGLVDELLKPSYDKITGEYLGCFDTINTDNVPQSTDAEVCLFDMKAQGYQTKVVSNFINAIEGGHLRMLIKKQEQDFNDNEREFFDKNVAPFMQTELLFIEISNLKLKQNGNNLSVEKVVRKIDKDRFSATAYCIFYIMEFTNKDNSQEEKFDYSNAPVCASYVSF